MDLKVTLGVLVTRVFTTHFSRKSVALLCVIFNFHIIKTKLFVLFRCPFIVNYAKLRIFVRRKQILDVRITTGIIQDDCATTE